YDAPARAPWLGGLPPVQITVGSADPFRDEDVAFASAIWRDGGDCELLVLPGGHHGYERDAPDSSITRLTLTARRRWINRILDPDDTSVVVPVPPPA
ncbi:MAG: alpha/beta hydrolase, partial [Propionibacteriaceae bacterium]|nr:alpha/beta hydrolase [Propionibacteriaceae bacterium]